MNPEPKPQKTLPTRIAERLKDHLESIGMGTLSAGIAPYLTLKAETKAEKAAETYIKALTRKRVVNAIGEEFCPDQKTKSGEKMPVSKTGSKGLAPSVTSGNRAAATSL